MIILERTVKTTRIKQETVEQGVLYISIVALHLGCSLHTYTPLIGANFNTLYEVNQTLFPHSKLKCKSKASIKEILLLSCHNLSVGQVQTALGEHDMLLQHG